MIREIREFTEVKRARVRTGHWGHVLRDIRELIDVKRDRVSLWVDCHLEVYH